MLAHRLSATFLALITVLSSPLFAAEDDYEFMPPGGWRGHSESGDDDYSLELSEGFIGQQDMPTRNTLLEPVDGFGGFDNVAPRLLAEEGPGGLEWDPSPTYRTRYKNETDYTVSSTHNQGNNWFTRRPYATYDSPSDEWRVRFDANTFRVYKHDTGAVYLGQYGNRNSKLVVIAGSPFVYDAGGKLYAFRADWNYRCESITGVNGNKIKFIESGGQLDRVEQIDSGSTTVRRWDYTISSNRIDKVEVQDYDGMAWETYREIDFTYHDDVTSPAESSSGDLVGVTDKQLLSSSTETMGSPDMDTWLHRSWVFKYYTGTYNASTNPGYPYQVKAVIGPESFRKYEADNKPQGDIFEATAADLDSYLDKEFEYHDDSVSSSDRRKLKKLTVSSACGCGGGEGEYDYAWEERSWAYLSAWSSSVDITYPDNSTRTYDYNFYGQTHNEVVDDGTDEWMRRWSYQGTKGYLTYRYPYAACTGYNGTSHSVSINTDYGGRFKYTYESTYYTLNQVHRRKDSSSEQLIRKKVFTRYPTGTGDDRRRFLKTEDWSYPAGGSGQKTAIDYDFHGTEEIWISLRTTTLPVVPTSENGAGGSTGVEVKDWFNADGFLEWSLDGEEYIHYREVDETLWKTVERVVDVDTSETGYTNPPDSWSTKTGAGLHLVTEYQFDLLGRQTRQILPEFDALDVDAMGDSMISNLKTHRRWFYTELANEESVVIEYPNVSDTDYYDAAVTLTVRNGDGQVLTSAKGDLGTFGDTTLSDDLDDEVASLASAFNGTIIQRQDFEYDGGSLVKERTWIDADGSDTDENKYTTEHTYNVSGQRDSTKNAVGTITEWEFDALGRVVKESVGTSTSNLKVIEERVYDEISGGSRTRNNLGHLTTLKHYPAYSSGGNCSLTTDSRVSEYDYDMRGRLSESREPENVKVTYEYSNLDRVTVTEVYDTAGQSDVLMDKREEKYDVLGRRYESRRYEVPDADSDGNGEYEATYYWRDGRGSVIKTRSQGDVFNKTAYDGAGRSVWHAVSYDTDEADTAYTEADDLTGDTVLEESQFEYDGLGSIILRGSYRRKKNGTGTGALTVGASGNSDPQFASSWYDALHRRVRRVNYGDNGDTDLSTRPSGPPNKVSSSTELISNTEYDVGGDVTSRTSPGGREDTFVYYDYGLLKKETENYVDGSFSSGSPDEDRITEYEYNAIGKTTKITARDRVAVDPDGSGELEPAYVDQVTEFVYGVTCNTGPEDSRVNSNDLLKTVKFPDPITGAASSDPENQEEYAYNALGQIRFKQERGEPTGDGNTKHEYTHDGRGRLVVDKVTAWESGLDETVVQIHTGFDALGRPILVTSYDEDTDQDLTNDYVNQVATTYGPYDTIDTIEQENDGEVDANTKTIEYEYSFPENGEDGVRRTKTIFPDATEVTDEYNFGTDDVLNRMSGRKESNAWIFQETYAGVDVLAEREFGSTGVIWILKRDRFDRPGELAVTHSSMYVNRYFHSYDDDSRLTFRENRSEDCTSNADFSEEYTYNALGALTKQERGVESTQGGTSLDYIFEVDCLTRDAAQNVVKRYVASASSCGTSDDFVFNASNEIDARNGDFSWADYNDQGDMRFKETESAGVHNTYDAWHRVVKVVDNSVTVATYEWNGLHHRVESGSSEDLYYGADGALLFQDTTSNDYWHVWGSQGAGDYVAYAIDANLTYFHVQDAHFNTVTQIFPSTGNVYRRYLYDGYGLPTALSSDWCSTETITDEYVLGKGHLYLKDTQLYEVGNALYDSELGTVYWPPDVGHPLPRNPFGPRLGPPDPFGPESGPSTGTSGPGELPPSFPGVPYTWCCVSPEPELRDEGPLSSGRPIGAYGTHKSAKVRRSTELGDLGGYFAVEMSCPYVGGCDLCSVDQRFRVVSGEPEFARDIGRERGIQVSPNVWVDDNPVPRWCRFGRLYTLDAPGGYHRFYGGEVEFRTKFLSSENNGCTYSSCTIDWKVIWRLGSSITELPSIEVKTINKSCEKN